MRKNINVVIKKAHNHIITSKEGVNCFENFYDLLEYLGYNFEYSYNKIIDNINDLLSVNKVDLYDYIVFIDENDTTTKETLQRDLVAAKKGLLQDELEQLNE